MRLHVRQPIEIESPVAVGSPQQIPLPRHIRRDQAFAAAVIVHHGGSDERPHPIAITNRRAQRLEVHRRHTFATNEPVRVHTERGAATVGRQRPEMRESDRNIRGQNEIRAADDGRFDITGANGPHGEVERYQRRRTSGLDDKTGPGEAEQIRQARRDHVERGTDQAVLGSADPPLLAQRLVVVPGRADVDSGPGAAQGITGGASVFQCAPGDFEHEPLLRVDIRRLARRDSEQRGVELVDAVEESAHRRYPLTTLQRCVHIPALGRHRTDRRTTGAQQLPESVDVVGPGESSRHTDDRNGFVHGFLPGSVPNPATIAAVSCRGSVIGDQWPESISVNVRCSAAPSTARVWTATPT